MSALSYRRAVPVTMGAYRTIWFADRPVGLTVADAQV